jgi:hypothetical protein
MEQVRFNKFVVALIIFFVWLTACDSDRLESVDNEKQLSEIAEFLKVEFPADAEIIHAEKNDRSNELAYRHIIYTQTPVEFNKPPVYRTPAEDTIKYLRKVDKDRKPGKLTDTWKYCYEGKVKDGEWSAYQTSFENGSYLDVKQFYF